MKDIIEKYLNSGDERMEFKDFVSLAQYGETNLVERKSCGLIRDEEVFKEKLGQEVSAFVNYGGGIILFGVDNEGSIEEGILDKKGKGTMREWLDSIVFQSVSPQIRSFAVKRIENEQKFLFAIFIGDSPQSPHQVAVGGRSGFKNKYYSRIDNQCQVIDGVLVRDIFNRQRSADIEIRDIAAVTASPTNQVKITFDLFNKSKVSAENLLMLIRIKEGPGRNSFTNTDYKREYLGCVFTVSPQSVRGEYEIIYPDLVTDMPGKIYLTSTTPCRLVFTLVAKNMPVKNVEYAFDGSRLFLFEEIKR